MGLAPWDDGLVGVDLQGAVVVGSVGGDLAGLVAGHDLRVGVVVAVAVADGGDGAVGLHGV